MRDIRPAPDSVVPDFDGDVRIRFDEPVNLTSTADLERRMFASPMEPYRLQAGFSDLRLRPRDGWRDSVVYCLTIPDGIPDLLRNRTEESIEFCFSTGIPIRDTRVQGTVFDAVTGQAQPEARVVFLAPGDSTPYGAMTDAEGRFAARALPPGPYEAFGFVDQNRNYALDRELEAHDSTRFTASVDSASALAFRVVPPDTTPPALLRADAVDSVTVELEFDDPLRNPQPGDPSVAVRDSASGASIPVSAVRVGRVAEVLFPGDTAAAADTAAVDPSAVPGDTAVAGDRPEPPGEAAAGQETGPTLPSSFVSLRLGAALSSGTYRIEAAGWVNLRALVGGGDTTFVVEPPPPAPDSVPEGEAAADTLRARR